MFSNQIYVSLRSDGKELTMQGQPELVVRTLRGLGIDATKIEIISSGQAKGDMQPPVMPVVTLDTTKPLDLLTLFQRVRPKSQPDQILLITHFYQKCVGLESLSLDNYQEAFEKLRRVPVTPPNNLKSSVRNVVDRTKYLRNADRGQYMLTLAGEEHVARLLSDEKADL